MNFLEQYIDLPCGVKIKNRICKAAMTERIGDNRNFANQAHHTLYKKWNDGNCGLLLTGNIQVDRKNIEAAGNVVIEEESYRDQIPALKKWVDIATRNGSHLWMQISHAGRQTPGELNLYPLAPSSIPLKIPGRKFGVPTEMTEEEIIDVINRFIFVGKVARESGFTGIQLHSAHGYLLSEFLSPDINIRLDSWGGSLENRARLLLEIINGCRKELGNDYPISVKLNSADFQKGGFSNEESVKVAVMLSKAGIDLLEISGGTYEQPKLLGYDKVSVNPKRNQFIKNSKIARESYFLSYAENISSAIDIPLMVTGGFRSRKGMEAALSSQVCQMIGIARPLCSDPLAIKKIMDGEIDNLPVYEEKLSIGPWWLSKKSPFRLIQAINAFSSQAWFYMQIRRMSQGLNPDISMRPFKAFLENNKYDQASIRDYHNHMPE